LKISRGTSVVLLLVYIIFLMFQLKSHAYLYESMPQERIDEEAQPGVLHDLLDSSSTSSSSSDDDDSDTDTTSGSVTTAKRIRRAFRHRKRRKSSASSKDTPSLPSHLSSPANEINTTYFDDTHYNSGQRRSSNLGPIMSGDEADDDAEKTRRFGPTRVRDFETGHGESSRSPERPIRSPSLVIKRKKKHRKRAHRKSKHAEKHDDEKPPITDIPEQVQSNDGPRVGFVEDIRDSGDTEASKKSQPPSKLRQLASRPALPKLLSQNVFTTPPQRNAASSTGPVRSNPPTVRRTASLPDRLNRQQAQSQSAVPTGSSKLLPPYIARPPSAPVPVASDSDEDEKPHMSRTAAVVMLIISTALVAVCAEFLVDAIPNMTSQSSVSQAFIGLIILPIVGNAAEHVTAVTVATKNKMDLAIGVAVGSSIQIALFVTPVVVLLGWILNRAMTLYFTLFETISLFVTAFVINFLILDGRSNYLEGTLLIAAYIIIAVAAFFYPDSASQSELGGSDVHNATIAAAKMLRMMF
jgi:Ca2+:H+ antiporter